MGKLIEEFTAEELYLAWAMADGGSRGSFDEVLDYIKANLDTGKREPMSVEDVDKVVQAGFMKHVASHGTMTLSMAIAKEIQPLTVQQGPLVDWSKAQYDGVKGVTWQYVYQTEEEMKHELGAGYDGYIPRPAPKMRQKTREEKISGIVAKIGDNGMLWEYSDEVIDQICRAADIPLETPE